MRLAPLTLLTLSTLVACATEAPVQPVLADTEAYIDRELLAKVTDNGDGVRLMQIEEAYNLSTIADIQQIGVAHLEINRENQVRETVALLENDHRIGFAEPNYLVKSYAVPNDSYVDYQWNMEQVNAFEALDYTDGSGAIVAVLDTGVRAGGPDGVANLLQGYDFANNDSNPTDSDGHGTFVAGTIAQKTNNGTGVMGMAPGAAILPVKVLGDNGFGSTSAIINGIIWATDEGADVINMSLGSSFASSSEQQACDYAYNNGVVVVAASGNEFSNQVGYPAAFNSVIAVGASRVDGTVAPYSNRGNGLEILAPGGDVSRDDDGDGYADGVLQETTQFGSWTYTFWEGTSMAAPHVAAAAAQLKSVGVEDPAEIREILASTAVDRGPAGYDTTYGYGVLNAAAALELALDGTTTEPEPEPEPEPEEEVDNGAPEISGVSGFTDGNRFTLQWVTDEPATSVVNFEDYGAYENGSMVTDHSLTFTGSWGATYVFTLESADADGNATVTQRYSISI